MHVEISQMRSIFQYILYFFLKIVHLIALRADILLFMNQERYKYDVSSEKGNWTESVDKIKNVPCDLHKHV